MPVKARHHFPLAGYLVVRDGGNSTMVGARICRWVGGGSSSKGLPGGLRSCAPHSRQTLSARQGRVTQEGREAIYVTPLCVEREAHSSGAAPHTSQASAPLLPLPTTCMVPAACMAKPVCEVGRKARSVWNEWEKKEGSPPLPPQVSDPPAGCLSAAAGIGS